MGQREQLAGCQTLLCLWCGHSWGLGDGGGCSPSTPDWLDHRVLGFISSLSEQWGDEACGYIEPPGILPGRGGSVREPKS